MASGEFISLLQTFAYISVLLFVGFVVGIWTSNKRAELRSIREAFVAGLLDTYCVGPHVLLNNVSLKTPEGATRIDHILVASTGIYILESLDYSGWILGDPANSTWTHIKYKKKSRFPNPIDQNYKRLKALKSLFTLDEDAFVSLVVFSGQAEFKTDLGPSVLHAKEIPAYLCSLERPEIFDERVIAYIVGRIEIQKLRRPLQSAESHLKNLSFFNQPTIETC